MDNIAELSREKATAILDAAQKRFAIYGLNKVTMDEIATDVGMGKASLYYYFPAKDHLFRAVIEREQLEFLHRIEELLQLKISAAEKLRRYTEQRLHYFQELVNLNFLSVKSAIRTKPLFMGLFESFAAAEHKYLAELLRTGTKSGEFDVRSPEATATLLLHILQGLRLRASTFAELNHGQSNVSQEVMEDTHRFMEIFLKGLRSSK